LAEWFSIFIHRAQPKQVKSLNRHEKSWAAKYSNPGMNFQATKAHFSLKPFSMLLLSLLHHFFFLSIGIGFSPPTTHPLYNDLERRT
jgi:hypothetical protein